MNESGLPTLDEFLTWTWPRNSYVDYPEFSSLYLRSTDFMVLIGDQAWRCSHAIQIGNIEAENPGQGAFGRLVADLVSRGLAIFVENVHNPRFSKKLIRMGFVPVNITSGNHFLINHEGHLVPVAIKGVCSDRA
jgi:hypothetical protein